LNIVVSFSLIVTSVSISYSGSLVAVIEYGPGINDEKE
jgi:hypothetical protein